VIPIVELSLMFFTNKDLIMKMFGYDDLRVSYRHCLSLRRENRIKATDFLTPLSAMRRDQKMSDELHGWGLSFRKVSGLLFPERNWKVIEKEVGDKIRTLYIPNKGLSKIQSKIMCRLLYLLMPKNFYPATAYFPGCSVIKNAEYHRDSHSSLVVDIKDAFESVRTKHVYRFLRRRLPTQSEEVHKLISKLLTYCGRLRLGPSISPKLFNLMMMELDAKILELIKSFPGMVYTRYADDLCFSSSEDWFPVQEIRWRLKSILESYGLRLNVKQKIGRHGNMEFPGVFVTNGRLTATMEVIRRFSEVRYDSGEARGFYSFFKQFSRASRKKIMKISNELVGV